jgi:transposase-like protein
MIYTTNAVEALRRSLRKLIKTRGSSPNDAAVLKLLCRHQERHLYFPRVILL